jgi:hypothetical protein
MGRKRHILANMLGIPIASRVEAANMSDQRAAARLLGGLRPMFPTIKLKRYSPMPVTKAANWPSSLKPKVISSAL